MTQDTIHPEEALGQDEAALNLARLEERIARLELFLGLEPDADEARAEAATRHRPAVHQSLEIQLGQNLFARIGVVILALGVAFLLTLPYRSLPSAAPSLAGYVLAGAIIGLAHWVGRTFPQIGRYLVGGGLLLNYFATVRLAHFGTEPALHNRAALVGLLLAVVAVNLVVAVRRKSPYLAAIHLTLGYFSALFADAPWLVFGTIVGMTLTSVFLLRTQNWKFLLVLPPVLGALAHGVWAVGNPLFGGGLTLIQGPEINLAFVLVYAMILAAGRIAGVTDTAETFAECAGSALNALGSFGLLTLLLIGAFPDSAVTWYLLASALYLGLAIAHWVGRRSRYVTFIHAMTGYTAMGAALIAASTMPTVFVWLCWEGVLVLSTAIWFRSKSIVVGNFLIYVMVLLAYLILARAVGVASVSFGAVALFSARVLNWKKERLDLRTELARNAYLCCALLILPYALYHSVPRTYISLSWLLVAGAYYVFSRWLRNTKYRWMALLTVVLTVGRVFLVDLVGLNPTFRIVSFLVLGTALLTISMAYSRSRAASEDDEDAISSAGAGARAEDTTTR